MNAKQKKFITGELSEFILREQGRGFAMDRWRERSYRPGDIIYSDDVEREVPKCGTVACIGGSAQLLLRGRGGLSNLGLTESQQKTLFHGWEPGNSSSEFGWPKDFQFRFHKATTAIAKAKIAVSLLKKVAETDGKILERNTEDIDE